MLSSSGCALWGLRIGLPENLHDFVSSGDSVVEAVLELQGNERPKGEHDRAKRGFDSVDGEYLS